MWTCWPSTGKTRTTFADQVHILPTFQYISLLTIHVIHRYQCVLQRPLIVGIAQLAHAVGSPFSAVRCGNSCSQKTLGWLVVKGEGFLTINSHKDNISETVLDRHIVTGHLSGSDTHIMPYPTAAIVTTLSVLEGHSSIASLTENLVHWLPLWSIIIGTKKLSCDHFLPCYARAVQAVVICLSADMIKHVFLILMS